MSGETEVEASAWTVDSLRAHVLALIEEKNDRLAEQDRRYEQRFAEQAATLKDALVGLRSFYDALLNERDHRYLERFTAQEKAVVVALAGVDKEFHEHLHQQRVETDTALANSDKAVAKAESATEKRFEAVNEFRAQQTELITTFARKSEVESRIQGLVEKFDGFREQTLHLAGTSVPRAEYERAHGDLETRIIQMEKTFSDKLEAQAKSFEGRIALLQAQLSAVEAVTR